MATTRKTSNAADDLDSRIAAAVAAALKADRAQRSAARKESKSETTPEKRAQSYYDSRVGADGTVNVKGVWRNVPDAVRTRRAHELTACVARCGLVKGVAVYRAEDDSLRAERKSIIAGLRPTEIERESTRMKRDAERNTVVRDKNGTKTTPREATRKARVGALQRRRSATANTTSESKSDPLAVVTSLRAEGRTVTIRSLMRHGAKRDVAESLRTLFPDVVTA